MSRQVRVEAVFETTGAVVSLGTYNAAIQRVIASQNQLSAMVRQSSASLTAQRQAAQAAASGAQNAAAAQVNALQGVSAAYNQVAAAAAAAAAQMRNANNQRNPGGGGGGGQGGGGGGNQGGGRAGGGGRRGNYFGLTANQFYGGIIAGYGAANVVQGSISLADSWTDINGRIRVALTSATEFNETQAALFEIAQRSRVSFADTANSFSRLMFAARDMGMTSKQAVTLADAIADAGRASYRTSGEIQSFITQFPQMLAMGKAGSDEWRSMKESFPQLVDTIAKNWQNLDGSIGVTRGQLEKIVRDGKGFSDLMVNAIFRGMDDLRAKAELVPRTFEQALVQLKNEWLRAVGQMADQTKFVDQMTAGIDRLIKAATGPAGLVMIEGALNAISSGFNALTKAVESGAVAESFLVIKEMVLGIVEAMKTFAEVTGEKGVWSIMNGSVFQAMAKDIQAGKENALSAVEDFREDVAKAKAEQDKLMGWQTSTRATPTNWAMTSRPEDRNLEAMRSRIKEQIAEAKAQIELGEVKAKYEGDSFTRASARLAIEKKITADMRERLPAESKQLEALLNQQVALDIANKNAEKDRGAKEKIAEIQQQIELKRVEMTGDQELIRAAQLNLSIEKLVTQELRDRNPELAKQLELTERMRAAQELAAKQVAEWRDLYKSMGDTLVNSMIAAGKEGRSFADGLKDVGAQFAEMLMKAIVLQPMVNSIAASLGGITGSAAGGGPADWMTGAMRSLLGAAAGSAVGGGSFMGGGGWATSYSPAMARGGVMMGGRITAYANGGIVNQPTLFNHSGGMGLMGEAGAEAIMPLSRGKNGKLGVMAAGGGGQTVVNNISVKVDGDMTDSTRQRLMADFDRLLASRTPGIVKNSVAAVKNEHQANPSYLRR